jgi:hypothetical protein
MDQSVEVFLAKPEGEREGPFSLDEVNQALAAGKYCCADYWAWHKGLDEWVPLYDVKGIRKTSTLAVTGETGQAERANGLEQESLRDVQVDVLKACPQTQQEALTAEERPETTPPANTETPQAILARLKRSLFQTPEPANEVTSYFNAAGASALEDFETKAPSSEDERALPDAAQPLEPQSSAITEAAGPGSKAKREADQETALLAQQFSSGMPFAALEQIFLFTTGDGQPVWSSPIVKRMLEAVIGEELDRIRESTPRDVIFNCDLSQLVKRDGKISDAVWRAMEIREPSAVARAQQKLSCTCVRTFHLETGTVVALILYYNNQKLNPDATSP